MAAKEKTSKPAGNNMYLTVKVYHVTHGFDYMYVVFRGHEPLLQGDY